MALNIADLFEHAVDAAPDNPAVKVGDRVVTYAELEAESNRLAHYLASRGVEAGDHVAVYAKNSVEHVVALLAVVKIRAVAINVNYRYVEGELNYLFDNADVVGADPRAHLRTARRRLRPAAREAARPSSRCRTPADPDNRSRHRRRTAG